MDTGGRASGTADQGSPESVLQAQGDHTPQLGHPNSPRVNGGFGSLVLSCGGSVPITMEYFRKLTASHRVRSAQFKLHQCEVSPDRIGSIHSAL